MKGSTISVIFNGKLPISNDVNSILTWCPKLNVIIKSMNKTSIWCYRLDGERLYSINNKAIIKNITFHENYFCLSGADSSVKVYDANDGALMTIIDHCFNDIQFLNWNSTEFVLEDAVLQGLPAIYHLSYKLEYLVINDANSLTINYNKLLNVSKATTFHFQQQLKSGLFHQVYLDKDANLVSVDLNVSSPKLYTDSIIIMCHIMEYFGKTKIVVEELQNEIKPLLTSIDRYLSNLSEETGGNLIATLSEILITNLIPESTKDFWLNQFGERGFKRLSKQLETVDEKVTKKIFRYLVSPMERVIVLINKLIGICKWNDVLGIDVSELFTFMNSCETQIKAYYKVIWDFKSQKEKFSELLSWWKTIIDILEEKEWSISYSTSKLLEYIQSDMTKPELLKHFSYDLDILGFNKCNTLENQQDALLSQFETIISQVNAHHSLLIKIEFLQKLNLPNHKDLQLTEWDGQTIITYLTETTLVISTPTSILATVPNVIAYQQRSNDLIALTQKHLLIIDSSSSIPISLPHLDFEPRLIRLNSSYVCLSDAMKSKYVVLQIE
ncbi:hypothetical protein KGF56_003023 [Candida oxycetoniae]|uniref:Anaphase-promoting complex subunit 4 n=1 Tax=Candida oxycetoniae TaxID=497107 RepID=A0AAI9WXI9_9ASCO|nr:uncharacterized protein KGF56_003023 [Candida oxycetoniae]KAI3404123.2 hypothetical protein KGF56_003023 [Candida oxycetoniae]